MVEARERLPVSVETWLSRLVGKTQNAYRRAWEDLFQFTGREPEEITPDDISRWLHDLSTRQLRGVKRGKRNWARRGYAESTAAQWAAAISSFYTAMETSSQGWRNPVMAVMRPRAPGYRSTSFLTVDEVRAWLRAIQRDTIHGRRNLAIGLTLITTGRRSAEVCRMRWGDLRRDGDARGGCGLVRRAVRPNACRFPSGARSPTTWRPPGAWGTSRTRISSSRR